MASHQVKRALESTESLIMSLLNREMPEVFLPPVEPGSHETVDSDYVETNKRDSIIDVEQSLLGTGEALVSSNSSAQEAARYPLDINNSPVNTLSSLVNCSLVNGGDYSNDPSYLQEQLYQAEKNVHLAAKLGLALSNRVSFLEKEVNRLTMQLETSDRTLQQARHELVRKESLLKLYYVHEEEESLEQEDSQRPPDWVQELSKENNELKTENSKLHEENLRLQQEVQTTSAQGKAIIKQIFEQFSETKDQLMEFQSEMERLENECHQLQTKLDNSYQTNEELIEFKELLTEENENLRNKAVEAETTLGQLSVELMDWQDKYDSVYALMKDAQEENKMLKDLTSSNSPGGGTATPSDGEHQGESIVQEIEEVLRRELITASTLTDRPVSPNNYAQQRTMVVMETVKAATLATARKLEKLAADQRKKEEDMAVQQQSLALPLDGATPEDIAKIRQQYPAYFSPQKLQIVKPMEGSVTLLRWKLLATPQFRGPSAFLPENERPGIHIKNYPSSDSRPGSSLQVDSGRRWHSVCDLSRPPVVSDSPLSRQFNNHSQRRIVVKKGSSSSTQEQTHQLSTVNRIKQNLWGLVSPSGRGKKSQDKQDDTHGLQELLGP